MDPAEFGPLNEQFYRMAPYRYLQGRVAALVTHSDPAADPRREGARAAYQGLEIQFGATDPTHRDEYAAIESTVLLHHAAEALLRLYLAHAASNPCPWLELSKLTSAAQFKEAVSKLQRKLTDEQTVNDLLEVFSGTADPSMFHSVDEAQWSEHRSALTKLIDHCCDVFLNQAPIYNAAKHGLALGAGEIGLALNASDGSEIFDRSGPAVFYLEKSGPPTDRHWLTSVRFVDPGVNLGWVAIILVRLESLWSIAKYRRVDGAETPDIRLLQLGPVDDLIGRRSTGPVTPLGLSERLHGPAPARNGQRRAKR